LFETRGNSCPNQRELKKIIHEVIFVPNMRRQFALFKEYHRGQRHLSFKHEAKVCLYQTESKRIKDKVIFVSNTSQKFALIKDY
jgi:hypothetical protein